jgi:hypothetical protein
MSPQEMPQQMMALGGNLFVEGGNTFAGYLKSQNINPSDKAARR